MEKMVKSEINEYKTQKQQRKISETKAGSLKRLS